MMPAIKKLLNAARDFRWGLQLRLQDYRVERALGVNTGGKNDIQFELSELGDAVGYAATRYRELKITVDYLELNADDVLIDYGCGKGRVVFFVAAQKIRKVIGVELDPVLMKIAKRNLQNLKIKHSPIQLYEDDAVNVKVGEATVFYFYNPFGLKTWERIIGNIKRSLEEFPRRIRIVYKNPIHRPYLDSLDWLVFKGQIPNTETFVWGNKTK